MPFVPYASRKSRRWRDVLTEDEAEKLEAIEREIATIDSGALKRRRELARERLLIQNRATHRAKAA